jgi:predicted transcriptional regulator
MSDSQAKVRSVASIEAFRSALVLFLSKARPTLEEVTSEVTRTRQWVQNDQRGNWQKEMKARGRELERAQGELFSARLSKISQASAAQQMAVHRAQRSVREAEDKLRVLKKWDRELQNRTEPMVKQIEQLHGFLTADMARAVAFLGEVIKTLEAYAEVRLSTPSSLPPQSADTEENAAPNPKPE